MSIGNRRRRTHLNLPRLESLEGRALMAGAGTLDPTFGAGRGFVVTPIATAPFVDEIGDSNLGSVAVQADGKVLLAGTVLDGQNRRYRFLVERLDPDGSPDATFGQGGLLAIPVPSETLADHAAVVVQPDGKIIVAGASGIGSSRSTYIVARLKADGTLDSGYGTDGVAEYPAGTPAAGKRSLTNVASVALQADGKLILAGSASTPTTAPIFGAVRLNANGSLDTSFGSAGTATVSITINGFQNNGVSAVALQSDGRIILAGTVQVGEGQITPIGPKPIVQGAVVRLNTDGTPDRTFGGRSAVAGQVLLPMVPASDGDDGVGGMAIQADDRIVVSVGGSNFVNTTGTSSLVRLNADGTTDAAFGPGGRDNSGVIGPVAIEPDGKIVTGGIRFVQNIVRSQLALTRFNSDGTPDSSFGDASTPGVASYFLGASSTFVAESAMTIQPDGKVVLAALSSAPTLSDGLVRAFATARVLPEATTGPGPRPPVPTPASFDASGKTDLAVYLPAFGAFAYRVHNDVELTDRIIPFGIPGAGQTLPAAADYLGSGQTLVAAYLPAFGVYAIQPLFGPDQLIPFGIPGAGQTLPAPADYDGDGKADIAVYLTAFGAFGIRPSSGGPDQIIPFGIPGAGQTLPAPADYDGDGKADLGVYLANLGVYAYRPSSGGPDVLTAFGIPGAGRTIPISGDYDGAGHSEIAVYLPQLGTFAYRPADGGPDVLTAFGIAGDGSIPAVGDYTGSGRTEIALYDPNFGTFAYRPAGGGPDVIVAFGSAGVGQSVPVAAPPGQAATSVGSSATSSTAGAMAAVATTSPTVSTATALPTGPSRLFAAKRAARPAVVPTRVGTLEKY